MRLLIPLYHTFMLTQLVLAQDSDSECAAGPVLSAGGWRDFLAPNKGLRCQGASIYFFEKDERHYVPIQYGDVLCHSLPSANVSLPIDAPSGLARITWLCDSEEQDYCQIASVMAATSTPPAANMATYAMIQNCPTSAVYTTDKYTDASNERSATFTTPLWRTPNAKGTANTPAAFIGTAPTRSAAHGSFTSLGPTAQPPETRVPSTELEVPTPTDSEGSMFHKSGSFTTTANGYTENPTIATPAESHTDDSGAAQTTQVDDNNNTAIPAPSQLTQTSGGLSPSKGEQAALPSDEVNPSGNNRPCTCGQ
ncbi:uncharacterized protein FPRO_14864 [Fusarium proliferatum ET1]|uniref:Uncharacterized protein n=1 Tax=Fusarium proliferatum (strain ET1) TaxID=1227346 RepID=A0A1L7WAP7_FUSPR|nr:uncharacterized protein FPRO_14864 [Fusarium proliferatum ET1]CZR49657.1 uncharacterized protein FPRO_14864 [Fusarium proliferatum ET1]